MPAAAGGHRSPTRAGGARRRSCSASHQPKEFLLAVEALTVSFDGFKAVDDLSLYVDENELRVMIGPNGAGKTTLLDLICGKTQADVAAASSSRKRADEAARARDRAPGVGRKFQTPSIYEDLTVFENLEMSSRGPHACSASLAFQRTPQVTERVEEVAEHDLPDRPARHAPAS